MNLFKTKVAKLMAAMFIILSIVTSAHADPMNSRTETINVGAGTDATYHFKAYTALLKEVGRTVTDAKVSSKYGYGGIAGYQFTHILSAPYTCTWTSQDATVNFFGDVYKQTRQLIFMLNTANKRILDMQIVSSFGTGKPAGIRIYFCR